MNSLSFRLAVSAAGLSIIVVVGSGLLLVSLFEAALDRNFDARLRAVLDGLLANVQLAPDGSPSMDGELADTRFSLPLSGWYWQVTPPNGSDLTDLASASLLEKRLEPDPGDLAIRDEDGIAHFYLTDANGTRLRAIEQRFKLFGGDKEMSFLVAGNFDELRTEELAFERTLVAMLSGLGVGLLAAIVAQVR